jgi:uncharacterized protein (DUF849 family)
MGCELGNEALVQRARARIEAAGRPLASTAQVRTALRSLRP